MIHGNACNIHNQRRSLDIRAEDACKLGGGGALHLARGIENADGPPVLIVRRDCLDDLRKRPIEAVPQGANCLPILVHAKPSVIHVPLIQDSGSYRRDVLIVGVDAGLTGQIR